MTMPVRTGILTALACALAALAAPAHAEERLLRFDSDITINADASLLVTETIEIRAEGDRFRRGLLRDFPTHFEDRLGNRVNTSFEIAEVLRNGTPETYRLEDLRNGIRVRIGDANRLLERGPHEYTITYRTRRQLGFFADGDELYWNVTGNGWEFPIDEVEARVRLPAGAQATRRAGYTGAQGATGKDFEAFERAGVWTFRTTRRLEAREGLTIAVGWPKGFVPEPGAGERLRWFLDDNAATGLAITGTLLVLLYYFFAWRRFGRDPETGTIIPRFEPPAGLSPAASRFIRMMAFDKQAYSAALINMAVKGYLVIESEEDSYRLRKEPGADPKMLSGGERRIAKRLFADDSILLDNENHEVLGKTVKQLKQGLKLEYERAYFRRNTLFFVVGAVLSAGLILLTATTASEPAFTPRALAMVLGSAFIVYLALHFLAGHEGDPTFRARPIGRTTPGILIGFIQVAIFLIVMTGNSVGASAFSLFANPVQSLCFALLGGLNVVFFFLLKRPTLAGRRIMDEIEGFRMYLSTAEEERLNLLNPPERTPELFEKYLPYALALDVENEWSEKFTRVLNAASRAPDSDGYRPRWYRGRLWRTGDTASFSRSLGGSLGAAVASSTTAPGSGSGSGGGGFSGGGGGGGGGGGW